MPIRGGYRRYHQTRDADRLASARIQGVLALEVALQGWPPMVPTGEIREFIREMSRANWL
jgi:hypothetical protein